MNTIAGLTKQMFVTMVAGPSVFGELMPVFDKPPRFSDYTKKLSEKGKDGATHVLRKAWTFDTEVYPGGTRVIVAKRIRFLGCRIRDGKVYPE